MSQLMDSKQYSVPISLLRQFCFCPRIPFFQECMHLDVKYPLWVNQGVKEHDRYEMLSKRRNLKKFGIDSLECNIKHNVYLCSEELKMHGICDSILSTKTDKYIVEFKLSDRVKLNLAEKVQLTAYAMAAESMYSMKISKGFILIGKKGKTFDIEIDQYLRDKTLSIRDHVINIIEKGVMPNSSATEGKCCQCEYFNFCADRF